jgi:hypothetical protein
MPQRPSVEQEPFRTDSAFAIAQMLHRALYPDTTPLDGRMLKATGVSLCVANPNNTRKLTTFGEIDGRRAYQTLSEGKTGMMYLTTVFTEPGGSVNTLHLSPGSSRNSDPELIRAVAESLFARRLTEAVG